MLADRLLVHATPAWTGRRAAEKARYVLRIALCKLEIALGIVIDTIGYQEIFLAIHHWEPSFVPMLCTWILGLCSS